MLPQVIQGGMGVAISDWRLARAVSSVGQLGVVSGTAVDVLLARRLQDGDPDGDARRALARLPLPGVAARLLRTYFVDGGKPPDAPYRPVLRFSLEPSKAAEELAVAGAFVEVWLAKEGHDGLVGINILRKIDFPIPATAYGAMLAGVDYVLVGAGNPADLPELLNRLSVHEPTALPVRVQGATSADGDYVVRFDPRRVFPDASAPLRRPVFAAIVASIDLAEGLFADPLTRPDAFVVEGPLAGGHNAPPRGPLRLDADGQPVFTERDVVDPAAMALFGVPFWMAGSYGSPEALRAAVEAGAAGVQVGTVFAYCRESGMEASLRATVLDQVRAGDVHVRTDPRVSPTGFPFKVVDVEGTLSDPDVASGRPALCDLAALRAAYRRPDGTVGYRCPSEPADVYVGRKGGREANRQGRRCLCNALFATAGFPQHRATGYVEPPIVTSGSDFGGVAAVLARTAHADGGYSAADVLDYLLGR
ncbi:MAG: nitronate monooxygenase [Kineosporiaceae bacterium]|jgi:NAD(P)H-dependent flavin oxidoreductase YrpB (nitropropane dioxygenase family)